MLFLESVELPEKRFRHRLVSRKEVPRRGLWRWQVFARSLPPGSRELQRDRSFRGIPVNKRRTYLDDLFVPYIDFYAWNCLEDLLHDKGFSKPERWKAGRLAHEESLDEYLRDLEGLLQLFSTASSGAEELGPLAGLVADGVKLCRSGVDFVRTVSSRVTACELTEA